MFRPSRSLFPQLDEFPTEARAAPISAIIVPSALSEVPSHPLRLLRRAIRPVCLRGKLVEAAQCTRSHPIQFQSAYQEHIRSTNPICSFGDILPQNAILTAGPKRPTIQL